MDRGVGTQIDTTSGSRSRPRSVVAVNMPSFVKDPTSALGTSWTWERPWVRPSTTALLTSNPSTRKPARANSIASGRPT